MKIIPAMIIFQNIFLFTLHSQCCITNKIRMAEVFSSRSCSSRKSSCEVPESEFHPVR